MLLQSGVQATEGYTDMTGTMMNMTLYLLPLITLLTGSVSTAVEKESGQWSLLSTYALSPYTFLWGKWIGLAIIMLAMIAFGFGLSGIIITLYGKVITLGTLMFCWAFYSTLALIYLVVALFIGAITINPLQALFGSISLWFITIVICPRLLISRLSL